MSRYARRMAQEDEALAALAVVRDAELERARVALSRAERSQHDTEACWRRAAEALDAFEAERSRLERAEQARVSRGEASARDLAEMEAWTKHAEARTRALTEALDVARRSVAAAEQALVSARGQLERARAGQRIVGERRDERHASAARTRCAARDDEACERWGAARDVEDRRGRPC